MGIFITNIASMRAITALNNSNNRLNTIYQRLSSGLRINSAKDDPAGLMISNRMTSEINGLNQATRNTSDGLALAQTVEGSMEELSNMLQRIRTLAVQSANGTYTQEDREALQSEVNQLSEEITRIAKQTKYGGETILDGKNSSMFNNGKFTLQVGAYSGDTISYDFSQSFQLDELIKTINGGNTTIDGYDATNSAFDVSTADGASSAIELVDKVIGIVDKERGGLGAFQNRLESVIRINNNTSVNLADARSRIRDTDYAAESANLFQEQIRQQAAMMMLMQSRQGQGNLILSLLSGI